MMRFIRNLFGSESKQTKRKSRRPANGRRLGLEGLESRDLMAVGVTLLSQQVVSQPLQVVAPAAVTISIENKDLVIRGTDGPDDVKVSYQGSGKYMVTVTTEVNGRASPTSTTWKPTGGDLFFYGNKGNDTFFASFSSGGYLNVTAYGGDGNDNLTGSWGNDNLKGGNGRDTLIGQSGRDVLDGGLGPDYMEGRDGNDTIMCGNDYEANDAFGGAGNDTITGSYGSDSLNGGGGNDTMDGRLGEDYLYGNEGVDYLFGGGGNDYLHGGKGADYLYGGDDDDELHSGGNDNADDHLYGEAGRDTFFIEFREDNGGVKLFPVPHSDYQPPYHTEAYDLEDGESDFGEN